MSLKAMLTKAALLTSVGLGLAARGEAGFELTAPAAIENKENGTLPCGEYNALDRTQVTDWPVLGHDVSVRFSASSTFVIRAALLEDLTRFKTLRPAVHSRRAGELCFMRIRGVEDWVGKDALVEVRQHSGGRDYAYRCAAVVFSEGGPASPACRGFHEQLVNDHERWLAEMAPAEQAPPDENEEARLEQRDPGDDNDGNDDDEDDDSNDDDDNLGRTIPVASAGRGPASTYTHLPPTPPLWGLVGKGHGYGRLRNHTAPLPKGQANTPGQNPGGGPADATPTPGGHELTPVPESKAAGFARGSVMLNLGLVAFSVGLFPL